MARERRSLGRASLAAALVVTITATAQTGTQTTGADALWTPRRTPWGDPDMQGNFTNKDETAPFERPAELGARAFLTDQEFAQRERRLQQQHAERQNPIPNAGSTSINPGGEWLEFRGASRRTSLLIDPADGRLPPLTAAAELRAAAHEEARRGRGEADSYEDRSLYDRCISRGLPGSMMPVIYGNSYRIVETANFDPKMSFRGSNPATTRLVERFTPTGPNKIEWRATVEDPETWAAPFTFAMDLTRDDREAMIEYACHEGNMAMANILSGHRADERAAAAAAGKDRRNKAPEVARAE